MYAKTFKIFNYDCCHKNILTMKLNLKFKYFTDEISNYHINVNIEYVYKPSNSGKALMAYSSTASVK